MPENMKCADCGLLQILKTDSREFVAVEPAIRESGKIPDEFVPKIGQVLLYERQIECLAGKPIRAEVDAIPSGTSWPAHFKAVLARPRAECDGDFVSFRPGLSPKDHREMRLLAEVERRNAQAQAEQVAREEKWRNEEANWKEQVEALAETRHRELRDDAKQNRKSNRRTAYAVAAIGFVASILAAILTVWLSRPTTPNTAPSLPQTNPQTTTAAPSPPPSSPE